MLKTREVVRSSAVSIAAIGVCVFATAAAMTTTRAPESYPVADTATTSIYTLRAARGALATGAYSRFYWHHPGPLLYQLLAVPYVMSGRREISLKWAALALNLGWLALAMAVISRRSRSLALALLIALVTLLWRDQGLLFSAWNPLVPVLALPAAAALAAELPFSRWALPALVGVVSYCVQAHIALATVGTVLMLVGVVMSLHSATSGVGWKGVWWASVVAIVLWAIPLWREFTSRLGNLESIARFLTAASSPHESWSRAGDIGAYALNAPYLPMWDLTADLVPPHVPSIIVWLTILEITAVMVVAVVAGRRGARLESTFAVIAVMAALTGPFAVHGIIGPVHEYLVRWLAAVGALNVAVLAWALFGVLGLEPALEGVRAPVIVVALAVVAAVGGERLWFKHLDQTTDTTIRALSTDLRDYCDSHGVTRPLLDFRGDTWQQGVGLVLQFYKADVPVAVTERLVYVVGEPFAPDGHEDGEFYVMSLDQAVPEGIRSTEWVTTRGGYRILRIFK